ncbi:MAG: NAD(P)/FAD-dependent oxidoreductase [Actinomycetales bacterium]|jgi:glycine/D-amino acid oxidase-like deaminating enzyme|nr:FAD-binding oxidoreductase [Leifsonia sp.]
MDTATQSLVNGDVSFWVQDAGRPAPRQSLPGDIHADVAIVGGGLTGLWTAYYLAHADPSLKIVILEREFAGYGASGRNGGWMSAEPAGQFRRYAAARGADAARNLQSRMFDAVRESVDIAHREGFADGVAKTGLIHVATSAPQLARAREHVRQMKQQGWGEDDVFELSASEIAERVTVNGALGGYWTPHCARVHPAKYTFGLARAVERAGVTIYEKTTATSIAPQLVQTDRGRVRAPIIVRALEGYTLSLDGMPRKLLPMNSSMVITERLSDEQLDSVGWSGGELLGDMAHSFTYTHKTADGRIAIGGRGVPYNFASGFDRNGRTAEFAVELLRARLGELFPTLRDVALEHTWSGVLGVPRDWCAAVNFDRSTGLASAGGYVGHGLSGTNLAARTLRDLILEEPSDLSELPWVGRQSRNWEFEPLRWIGATALYAAYRYADQREYASRSGRTNLVARLADTISGR